ncbi:bifunctional demethylmenaquinone methyltransferase/2-methoxy-6-polyprenyl-1,4-benzoquinol methylase UbiE [Sphingobacterium sp. DK4209]|uniref:Demethylmenaquinone methyltransferase n=1 Tax=Sphingobacterium zhuxiongii TaxID=2662364 RepID=A0A5Q0QES5_9SPHI|nr:MULTISPECIES: bifunctional demethylmenaquinone methyltransferase/2-methoxy-6-polyprenyl-1,4-benzoquinol methylase UbiE [unclassified Sphingobacterium]MVZ64332.1 bifunctional demethylmenaquinone methyltransferase/2-methoxy-6-polyprenyl-1,4-benzoquinol methylase UbiE [Sphingobacterium sp. DK4209]QGA25680.1 bifunctional demethylmenaquinone methyltransferase/2-methoxy-6-polyprenyl-1,4-benzoquinol methylase UbiE [Sphingobacterium sp. dk4302]
MSNDASTVKPYNPEGGKKEQVADMFNNISKTYDLLNRFMTMGIDTIWRKKAIRTLKPLHPQLILDVATGTGDFALESIRILNPKKIIGVDISQGMLDVAAEKAKKKGLTDQFEVRLGDSESLPFDDNTFDAVTVAFGVRNFENLEQGLSDIRRVLKPGGKAIILELSNPTAFPIKQLFRFYFHKVVPAMGKLISKDNRAYEYLPESVAKFPDGERFAAITDKVGFASCNVRPQTFGFCTIYECNK